MEKNSLVAGSQNKSVNQPAALGLLDSGKG